MKLLRSIGKCLSILLGLGLIQPVGLQAQPAGWTPVLTGQDHTLVITQGSGLELDGDPLPVGSWLGAFFSLPGGGLQCAGAVEWKGVNTVLPIYGANGTMPPQGFATGEAFNFRLWIPGDSCIVDSLQVSYQMGGVYTHQGTFAANGLSGLASLQAYTGLQLELGADTSLCEGESLILRGGCCAQSYQWSTGDSSNRIFVSDSGQYSLLMLSAAGCSKRDTISVDVTALPEAQWQGSQQGDTVTYSAQPQASASYRWDFGDGSTDTGLVVTHVYAQPGTYTVRFWVENVCGKDSLSEQVTILGSMSLVQQGLGEKFRIFPQPASEYLWLSFPIDQFLSASLTDLTGKHLAYFSFNRQMRIPLAAYPSGLYFIKLHTPSGYIVNKTVLIKK